MIESHTKNVLQYLRSRVGPGAAGDELPDNELLQRFAARRDQAAFQTLMRRHGPMVLRVSRRLLDDRHDAEDVFQATFLVLTRKAAGLVWYRSLASWLYEVAHRLAQEARRRAWRRRTHEARVVRGPSTGADPLSEISGRELLTVLDEELVRLPERFRAPMVLCCLEGHSGEEAARQLGCSLSTLRRRLGRGREVLRNRLIRRGVTLSAMALGSTLLLESVAPAAVPAGLAGSTLRAADLFAAGKPVAGAVPNGAVELAKKAANQSFAAKLKLAAAVILALGMVSAGAGAFARLTDASATEDEPRNAAAALPAPAKPEAKPEDGKDLLGDPLPPEALARLGTSRLHGYRRLFFTPDGRNVVRDTSDYGLQISEIPRGKPLARIRAKDMGRGEIIAGTLGFSRDGKYLAAACWNGGTGIWETATGRLAYKLESGRFFSIQTCVFSPDGKLLAVGAGANGGGVDGITVGVYEIATGRQLFATPGTNGSFAPDGGSLVTWNGYGSGTTQTARRVAVPSGEEIVTFTYHEQYPDFTPRSDGSWFFEVAADHSLRVWDAAGDVKHVFGGPASGKDDVVYVRHAPGRREVMVVRTAPAAIWCWDLNTGKELWQAKLAAPAYFPTLSADGSTLVTGEKTGRLRVWDVATGKERVSFRPGSIGHRPQANVSPDGRTVATTSGGSYSSVAAIWDAKTGKLLSGLPGHTSEITAAAFTPDGSAVCTIAEDQTLRTWDPSTGRERLRAPVDEAEQLAVAPDGSALFAGGGGGAVRVLEPATGKCLREIPAFGRELVGMALTADGKRLIVAGRDGKTEQNSSVRVYDAATGAKLREFGDSEGVIEQLAVRPDGGAVAASFAGQRVVVWDGDGKRLTEQTGRGNRVAAWTNGKETPYRIGSIGLSADGRRLAYSDQEAGIAFVDLRTGHETGRAKTGVYYQSPAARDEVRDVLAFSPDGKTVAWSGVESTANVYLIEVRTAKVRRRLKGDSYVVQHLAFSPDGSKLLSAGPDGSALIWDVFDRSPGMPAGVASAEEVAGWWGTLGDPDAAAAYGAMRQMARNPSAAVALLREKLKPVREVEAKKFAKLLTELDGPTFEGREAASRKLVTLGDAVEPRLRQILEKPPSLEVGRRVEDILSGIEKGGRLASERAVEVLEMIGDRATRQLLSEWAAGMPGAPQTVDAAAALARLKSPEKDK
jgi:RNA polymerase sigma factor (sigma-70 family)